MNEQANVTLTTKKYLLQKIAKFISILCIIVAFLIGGYLLFFNDSDALQLTLGVVAFFFSAMAVVLFAIGTANLPDLSISHDN